MPLLPPFVRRLFAHFANDDARSRCLILEEQLEAQKVINRIQEIEIKHLTAVIARDFQRTLKETRDLGGSDVKAVAMENGAA